MRFTYPAISAGYEIPNTTRLFAQIRSPKPASRHSSQENASQWAPTRAHRVRERL